jgi:hypothetical protein
MKSSFIIIVSIVFISINSKAQTVQPVPYINPSGYYSLDTKITVKDGDTYGYFGNIKVKLVDSNRIFMEFYVCKGAPSYNSGSFEDTLTYKNGIAVRTTSDDASCVITFNFNTTGGVTVEEKTKDINGGCGFGHAVVANGFYRRITGPSGKAKSQ